MERDPIDVRLEHLEAFRAEWAERFGFLAVEHAADSLESIDEVAGILKTNADEQVAELEEQRRFEADLFQKGPAALESVIVEREAEIRLLRRERRLLVDLDIAKSGTIGGLLAGEVRQSNLKEIERLQVEVLKLHLDASAGLVLPEGTPCHCQLCRPTRDLGVKVNGDIDHIPEEN